MRRICVVGLLVVLGGTFAGQSAFPAQPPEPEWLSRAEKLYLDGRYAEALPLFERGAQEGNARSQARLGWMYKDALGVKADPAKARMWLERASEQGDPLAYCGRGHIYSRGFGVESNEQQAAYWYRKSAEGSDADGQLNYGYVLANGRGVEKNLEQSAMWYRRSAEQGNLSAQSNLGRAYNFGLGVARDVSQAVHWYRKAADRGFSHAQNNLAVMYRDGDGVPQDFAEAARWFQRAAESGNAISQRNMGVLYMDGRGVPQDTALGLQWIQKGAAGGDQAAKEILAKHQQRVEQLLDIFGISAVCESTVDSIVKQAVETEPGLAGSQQAIHSFLTKKVGWAVLKPEILRMYMERLSEKELEEVVGFYESRTGRKFAAVSPVISAAVMDLVQKTLVQSATEWEALTAKLLGSAEPQ